MEFNNIIQVKLDSEFCSCVENRMAALEKERQANKDNLINSLFNNSRGGIQKLIPWYHPHFKLYQKAVDYVELDIFDPLYASQDQRDWYKGMNKHNDEIMELRALWVICYKKPDSIVYLNVQFYHNILKYKNVSKN